MASGNGWDEHKNTIIFRLDQNDAHHDKMENKNDEAHANIEKKVDTNNTLLTKINTRLTKVEVRASFFGGLIGSMGGVLSALAVLLLK